MRTIDPELAAHLAGDATTVCHAWRVTRRDGRVLGFTEHGRDLSFAGMQFQAASGFSASETEEQAGLPAVSSEVAGGFVSEAITEEDLSRGRYDGARVEVFLVNWADPAQHLLLKVQEIGEVTRDAGQFRAELRSFAHRLGQPQGRIYNRRCDAVLGDGRCGIDLTQGQYLTEAVVESAVDAARLVLSSASGFGEGFFRHGVLTFLTGPNAGERVDIDAHADADGRTEITLWLPLARPPEVGDRVLLTAGCDKAFSTCRAKFGNGPNFQGFPHMPGSDFAYSYADGETVHDGRPLFP